MEQAVLKRAGLVRAKEVLKPRAGPGQSDLLRSHRRGRESLSGTFTDR